ncbi:MAG: hypothetical protein NT018_10175 [Armatimonadetes bacterium]|nr:hypothetical protein [Armatimonadota bacterium]
MKLICVGGLSSGCGKTSVACLLLKALPGWGAMKVTPSRSDDVCPRGQDCEACQPPDGPYYVAIDSDIPERPEPVPIISGPVPIVSGTDTSRFRDAGASHVAFVRALPECLPIALEYAFERLSDLPGVIVETTTAMPLIDGLRILVARQGRTEVKDSAHAVSGLADILAVNQDAASSVDGSSSDFPFAAGLPTKRITVCACLPPEHSCNQDLIAECRLFLEC